MIRLQHPTVHVPPWPLFDDPAAASDSDESAAAAAADAYSCDEFRMYEFKVRRCARGRSHDWTECPYAHPGEKARRRDPRRFHYSGAACPEFRKGSCKRGDSCEFAHGVFECWLHPARYRTQPCKDGVGCRRRVCFFAHTPDQLRVVPPASQQSPRAAAAAAAALEAYFASGNVNNSCGGVFLVSSPTSTLASPPMSPTSESPPMSPVGMGMGMGMWRGAASPVNEVLASLRKLQISKARGLYSLPATPTAGGVAARRRGEEEDEGADPDLEWVSELVE